MASPVLAKGRMAERYTCVSNQPRSSFFSIAAITLSTVKASLAAQS